MHGLGSKMCSGGFGFGANNDLIQFRKRVKACTIVLNICLYLNKNEFLERPIESQSFYKLRKNQRAYECC